MGISPVTDNLSNKVLNDMVVRAPKMALLGNTIQKGQSSSNQNQKGNPPVGLSGSKSQSKNYKSLGITNFSQLHDVKM